MDAAHRAELDRLRRRVYGPEGDDAPATVRRLIQLEDELRRERPPAAEAPADATAAGAERPSRSLGVVARRGGTLLPWVFAAGALVVAVLVGVQLMADPPETAPLVLTESVPAREAYSLARDTDAEVLLRIPYTEPTQNYEAPWFPTSGTVTGAALLATLYGWEVWIADADGAIQPEQCLTLRRGPVERGRCVPAVLRDTNALAIAVSFDDADPEQRPERMTPAQRIGFWWAGGGGGVYVLLADAIGAPR